jgi:hypothetical protein
MSLPGTWKVKLIAGSVGVCVATITRPFLEWICQSPAGSLVAIGLGVGAFAIICLKSAPPAIEAFHPSASLYELTIIRALAAMKNGLQTKYFGDKHWHFEMLEAEEGIAFFVLKFQEQVNSKTPPIERTILLNVKVNRIGSGISAQFDYDPISYKVLDQNCAVDICNQTTEFLEQQLFVVASKIAVA